MKNKVITSQGNVQFIFPDGKVVNVHPNHIYTVFTEDTVSFILVALPKSSGLALMTSKAEDLELNGETYSFAELPAAMSEAFAIAGAQARCEIVDELPETGYTNTIYLVPQPSPQTGFDEYVYILDQGWELIGDTSIEMENYVTKTVFSGYTASTAAELSGKAEVVEITQANYDLLPSSAKTDASKLYVISDAQPIDLSVYAKVSAVTSADTALDNKIDAVSGATSAALALKQNILTAGTGIDITSDVISVTGSTGGITSGEVQTMIDESISGKADTSSLATVATSGSYNDLTNKPTIPTVPTSNTAFTNDAQYATSGYVDSAVSGKANSSDVYLKNETSGATEIATALALKLDATAYTPTVVDSALDSRSTNPVENQALFDELRIGGEPTETILTYKSNRYTNNYPAGCTEIKIDANAPSESMSINAYASGRHIGSFTISTNSSNNITVSTYLEAGDATYSISGTVVTISYPDVTNVTMLEAVNSQKPFGVTAVTYAAIVVLKDQVSANTAAISGKADTATVEQELSTKLDASAYTPVQVSSAITENDTNPVQGGVLYDKFDEIEQVTARALNNLAEADEVAARALVNLNDRFGGLKLQQISQSDYDALVSGGTVDASTLYVIVN